MDAIRIKQYIYLKEFLIFQDEMRLYIIIRYMQKGLDFAYQPLQPSIVRCGCYVKSEEILKLHPKESVLVPLVSSQYDVTIYNTVANVTLHQTYKNPTETCLQLEYSFPIHPNACIYKFVATFGNKRIEGIIKQKEEALAEYQNAIKENKKAAYGALSNNNKDILNLKIGNIQPMQSVDIEIVFLQELTISYNTFYELQMIGTISPRYMNHIRFEQIKKAFANTEQKVKGQFYWNFKLTLKTKQKINFFKSKSHQLTILSQNEGKTQLLLAMDNECRPNKDFTFTYTTQNFEIPTSVYGEKDNGSAAIISFIPKFCSLKVDDAYKQSLIGTPYENDVDSARGEYIFLLDRSGSMSGGRIQKAKEALALFIKSLPQDTYFNVISFGSCSEKLFPLSVKYGDKYIQEAVKKIKTMQADMGGTEIYETLSFLLNDKEIEGYPKHIFLLTDGGVDSPETVIEMVGNKTRFARVHTIGFGFGCSEQLILGCAKSGKGHHVFITDKQNPSEKIIQILIDSLSPVISKMKLVYDKEIIESIVPNPDSLPYILKNQLVNFCINFKGKLEKPTKIILQYEDSHNKFPYRSDIEIDPKSQCFPSVDRMSKFKKIRLLQESQKMSGNLENLMYFVKTVDKKKEMIRQSVDNQILSQYTAFICVESELIDGKYQEITNTIKSKIHIENIQPEQGDYKKSKYWQQQQEDQFVDEGCIQTEKSFQLEYEDIERSVDIIGSSQKMMDREISCSYSIPKVEKQVQKQKSGGFFSSIKNFFGIGTPQPVRTKSSSRKMNIKQQSRPSMGKRQTNKCAQIDLIEDKEYSLQADMMAQNCQMDFDQESIKQSSMKQSKKKKSSQPEGLIQLKPSFGIKIGEVVALQSSEGCWKDLILLSKLYSAEVEDMVLKQVNKIAVVTYLIAKWIQRYHPEGMYKLIVKKGLSYVKKQDNLQQIQKRYFDVTK